MPCACPKSWWGATGEAALGGDKQLSHELVTHPSARSKQLTAGKNAQWCKLDLTKGLHKNMGHKYKQQNKRRNVSSDVAKVLSTTLFDKFVNNLVH